MPTTNPTSGPLLEPDFIARLERLEIVSRKIFHGKMRGERRSKRRGESVEFADYRNYVSGDDLRHLDWNIYARLEKLFVKLFQEEEDLHVNLLVDISGSMDLGTPRKSRYAMQIAAAMAYIGLSNNDRVSLYAYADGLSYELAGLRGKRMIAKVFSFLGNVECGGVSNMARACKQYAMRHSQAGIVLVLSDFFDKGGYDAGLRMLLGRKYDVYCIQVLAPEEIDPKITGELRLTDVEDDDIAEVSVSRALINRYKHNLKAYCEELQTFCSRRGMTYALASTEVAFDQIVMGYLRRRGLLK